MKTKFNSILKSFTVFSFVTGGAFAQQAHAVNVRTRIEVYSVDKEEFKEGHDDMKALLKAQKATLITGSTLTSPSGQRAASEATKDVTYANTYDAGELGFETRKTGVVIEVEPVVGADGYTVDMSYIIQYVTSAPENEWRQSNVGNGLTVVDPKFATQKLTSTSSFYLNTEWKLIGVLSEVTGETGSSVKKVFPVYIKVEADNE